MYRDLWEAKHTHGLRSDQLSVHNLVRRGQDVWIIPGREMPHGHWSCS
jgi:hypothetical protein